MAAIEGVNPTAAPASSELLGGKWSLLYTGASADDAANRRLKEVMVMCPDDGACKCCSWVDRRDVSSFARV